MMLDIILKCWLMTLKLKDILGGRKTVILVKIEIFTRSTNKYNTYLKN